MEHDSPQRRLERLVKGVDQLRSGTRRSAEFIKWESAVRYLLKDAFGDDSKELKEFEDTRYHPFSAVMGDTEGNERRSHESFNEGLDRATALLGAYAARLEYLESKGSLAESPRRGADGGESTESRKVFIVHGRDSGTVAEVKNVVSALKLDPVILGEQPDRGRTIIEKFEDYAEVPYAIVLFTPDDAGGLADDTEHPMPRARQNVVLELGFFLGRLGRDKVCVLVKDKVEFPSDYQGVVYEPMDEDGGWRLRLVKELEAAGMDVDANRLVSA